VFNINITMYELVRTQLYLNMVHGVVICNIDIEQNTTGMTHLKVFCVFFGWSPCQMHCLCSWKSVDLLFAKSKFCLKCGNCNVQVDGRLIIYSLEIERYFD